MKRGTIRHPKLLHLASLLRMPPYAALGLLEALLDWTFDFAREGDVGRHGNRAIAVGVGWDGDPERLVAALVTARWLDRCATHRLVVHGLAEHAPETWKRLMARHGKAFAVPVPVSTESIDNVEPCVDIDRTACAAPAPAPDLSLPSVTQGAATSPRPTELGFDRFWAAYPKKRHKPAAIGAWKAADGARHLEAILAGVERWKASENWIRGFIEDPSTFLRQRQWEDEIPAPHRTDDDAAVVKARIKAELFGKGTP